MNRRQSSEVSYIDGGGRSEAVPQECTRPLSYPPRNQPHETSSNPSRPESNEEIVNAKDPPKASQERPILATPPFIPHPELSSSKEMENGIMRTGAGVISSSDNEAQETTGHNDGLKPCTGADVSELGVQQVHLPQTGAVATSEKQATNESTNGSLAGLAWKDHGEEEPSTKSGRKRLPETTLIHQDFGLRNWKEYAALRQVALLSLRCPFYASTPGSGVQSPAQKSSGRMSFNMVLESSGLTPCLSSAIVAPCCLPKPVPSRITASL